MFGYLLLIAIVVAIAYLFIKAVYFDTIEYRYSIVSKKTGKIYYKTNSKNLAEKAVSFYSDLNPEDLIDYEENEDINGGLNLTA